jgi:hypothetical protein
MPGRQQDAANGRVLGYDCAQDNVALPQGVQDHIGRHLRALYDEVVLSPIPDRFLKLLEDLERKRAGQS